MIIKNESLIDICCKYTNYFNKFQSFLRKTLIDS